MRSASYRQVSANADRNLGALRYYRQVSAYADHPRFAGRAPAGKPGTRDKNGDKAGRQAGYSKLGTSRVAPHSKGFAVPNVQGQDDPEGSHWPEPIS